MAVEWHMLSAACAAERGFCFRRGKVTIMRRNLSLVLAGSLLLGTAWMSGCKDKDTSNGAANDAQKAADTSAKTAEQAQKQESAATQKGEMNAADMAQKGKEDALKAKEDAAKANQELKGAVDAAKNGATTTPDNK